MTKNNYFLNFLNFIFAVETDGVSARFANEKLKATMQ